MHNATRNLSHHQAGQAAKADAHATLEARRGAVILSGRRALLLHLLDHGAATADDIRAAVEIPAGVDPVALVEACPMLAALELAIRCAIVPATMPAYWRTWRRWERVLAGLIGTDEGETYEAARGHLVCTYQDRARELSEVTG